MEKQKKKLSISELKVSSFVTVLEKDKSAANVEAGTTLCPCSTDPESYCTDPGWTGNCCPSATHRPCV